MAALPKRVTDRIADGIKKFQPIIHAAKSRDINESDTVIIVTDVFAEVFGYDKFIEITSEVAIRGTFCDLAVKIEDTLRIIIEVKAIGLALKDSFVKQAVDYAANQGVEWVVLTNGEVWRIYRVVFGRPIDQDLVFEISFSTLNHRSTSDIELLFTLTKEGWQRSALGDLHERKRALSRYFLGAIVLSDPVLAVIRRELQRLSPNVKIDTDEISVVLAQEVIKRDVLEGDQADAAKRRTKSAASRPLRVRKSTDGESEAEQEIAAPPPIAEEST